MSSSMIGTKREREEAPQPHMNLKSLWLHSILIDALTRRDQTHRGLNALTRLRTPDGSHIALDTKAPPAISTPLMDAIATGRPTSIPECWKAKCKHLQVLIDEWDHSAPQPCATTDDNQQKQHPTLEEVEELELMRQVVLQGVPAEIVKQEDKKEDIKAEMDNNHNNGEMVTVVKQEEVYEDQDINDHSAVVSGPQKPHVEEEEETENNQTSVVVEEPQAPAVPRNPKSKLGKLILQAKKKLGNTGAEETVITQQPIQPLSTITRRAPLSAAKSSDLISSASGIRRGITVDNGSDDSDYDTANSTTTAASAQQQQPQQNKQLSFEEFQTTHKRAPRQGEIGITVEEIEREEALGYEMSGSRNRNVRKMLESKQQELHAKQADKQRLGFVAEDDRRKDEEALAGLLDLF